MEIVIFLQRNTTHINIHYTVCISKSSERAFVMATLNNSNCKILPKRQNLLKM